MRMEALSGYRFLLRKVEDLELNGEFVVTNRRLVNIHESTYSALSLAHFFILQLLLDSRYEALSHKGYDFNMMKCSGPHREKPPTHANRQNKLLTLATVMRIDRKLMYASPFLRSVSTTNQANASLG
jgi:hypothetical protein